MPEAKHRKIPGSFAFAPPSLSAATNPSGSVYLDNYSQGVQIGEGNVPNIVANAINAFLPADPNGVYFVLTSPDVKFTSFCVNFCAYHKDTNV